MHGDLAGLFDGAGEPLVFGGELVVVDLSAQWSSNSLSVAVLSAVAAAQQVVARSDELGYLVIDEAWALLSDPNALRWLQGSWKLARARGLSHVMVLHRWSDIAAAGDAGSVERERARGCCASARRRGSFANHPMRRARWPRPSGSAIARSATSRRCPRGRARALRIAPLDRAGSPRRRRPHVHRHRRGDATRRERSTDPWASVLEWLQLTVLASRSAKELAARRRTDPGGQDLIDRRTGASSLERRVRRDQCEERRHRDDAATIAARLVRRRCSSRVATAG